MAGDSGRSAPGFRHGSAGRSAACAPQRERDAAPAAVRRLPRARIFGRAVLWPYTFWMVSLTPAPLTRIGFRRDVRLFLIGLVGFLVVLIFSLLLLLRTHLTRTQDTIDRSRLVRADVAADPINHTPPDPHALHPPP